MSSGIALEAEGGRWKRYPAYRDSGVEWIGEVPEGWELLRIKQLAQRIQTGSTPPTQELHYYENGSIPWFGPGSFGTDLVLDKAVKLISKTAVKDGVARIFKGQSTMIVTIGATIGKVGYIESSASSNQQITAVTFDMTRAIPKFAAYQIKRLEPVLRGIAPNTTLPILNQGDIGHLPFCLPSIPEQRAIAAFLDRETGRIDALVVKKERQIGLLREKRTALISHAVTKGLDPNAPMKDSGVEWLGAVPDEWGVKKIKNLVSVNGRIGFRGYTVNDLVSEGKGALTLGAKHINKNNELELLNPEFISWEKYYESPEIMVSTGDLILTQRGSVGKVAIINKNIAEATINPSLVLLKTQKVNGKFLYYFLISDFVINTIILITASTAVPMISQEQIGNINLMCPPLPEQHAIAAFLDRETGRIDTLTAKVRESISKLHEYRTALISAAVTGKIDVREELVS